MFEYTADLEFLEANTPSNGRLAMLFGLKKLFLGAMGMFWLKIFFKAVEASNIENLEVLESQSSEPYTTRLTISNVINAITPALRNLA